MKNMVPAHRRHDLSDEKLGFVGAAFAGREGVWGDIAKDNRLFINAVFWILRTGAPWRFAAGLWRLKLTHRRFIPLAG